MFFQKLGQIVEDRQKNSNLEETENSNSWYSKDKNKCLEMARGEFKGGNNIALKIPKFKYSETVHFYKEVIKLPYLGFMSESHAFQFGDATLWLDCMDNYSQQDVWLEIQTDNVKIAAEYLQENHINRRDEVEVHENSEGYWISDPCGTILRVNPRK
ncbi:hypothetical protein J1TS3_17940 [Siminovitchia fordii]|uniref:VOC domain-containing protein n=1 Tax=Siminovitchia fordii TaxID=254759 RepID=A0ABQ4K6M7_9BACI|nr:hypothetical protein [Siminovitchia fordii]GIN20660.1 hypothetical protein J1TS3_17940 [Siminovitchia fordii]